MKYHVSVVTGDYGVCHASIVGCPYMNKNIQTHFSTLAEAEDFSQKILKEKYSITKTLKKENNEIIVNDDKKTFEELLKTFSLHGKSGKDLYDKNDSFNDGFLVENDYFSFMNHHDEYIDVKSLNGNSYMDYGFCEVFPQDNYQDYRFHKKKVFTSDDFAVLSNMELNNLSDKERAVLRFYSSQNFNRLNYLLHHGEISMIPREMFHQGNLEFFVGDNLDPDKVYDPQDIVFSKNFIREVTGLLDSGLDKSFKNNRVVYRGIREDSIKKRSGLSSSVWVDRELSLGSVVSFNNYVSTSMSPIVGSDFSGDSGVGIVYEIMTVEGLNIVSSSQFSAEQEVLLPRQTKYCVVGVHKNVRTGVNRLSHVVQLISIDSDYRIIDDSSLVKRGKAF